MATKKTITKKTTGTATSKKTPAPKTLARKASAKKSPSKKSPAKKTSPKNPASGSKAMRDAKGSVDANLKAIAARQDHEVPSPKEVANDANLETYAKAKRGKKVNKSEASTKRPSGLDLAAKVLAEAGEPLGAKDIAKRVIAAGWATKGKTPHATLYAAISREITTKGTASRFAKADRGTFKATGKGAS